MSREDVHAVLRQVPGTADLPEAVIDRIAMVVFAYRDALHNVHIGEVTSLDRLFVGIFEALGSDH